MELKRSLLGWCACLEGGMLSRQPQKRSELKCRSHPLPSVPGLRPAHPPKLLPPWVPELSQKPLGSKPSLKLRLSREKGMLAKKSQLG